MRNGELANIPNLARDLTSKKVLVPAGSVVIVTNPQLRNRQIVVIRNVGKDTIYLGDSSVTDQNGFPLFVNEVIVLPSGKDIFAFSPSKDGELRVIEG